MSASRRAERSGHLALEAVNLNPLDEVPDSTWFTNRHARRRLSAGELARGPNLGPPPAANGTLTVLSGKALGMTAGFIAKDAKGDRYVVKFDAPGYAEVATGAEIVCSKIVHALGWNVAEYHLFTLDPGRLRIGEGAWVKDVYRRKRPMTQGDLRRILERVARQGDGRIRALASRYVPGVPKRPFRTLGVRSDDPNDTVFHEDRRELRGLRVVAAWINFTDARRGNFYDSFVRPGGGDEGPGVLRHYLLDFSNALGSGNDDWKHPRYGHEYLVDPPKVLFRLITLGFWKPPWAELPLTHPALGYFESSTFDPEEWRPTYLNPHFDRATMRDLYWGAKLVSSLRDEDLRIVVHAGEWSDPTAENLLARILGERRERIARAYFDFRRINPVDDFAVRDGELRLVDLAVRTGLVAASDARYRHRAPHGDWSVRGTPLVPLPREGGPSTLETETSHDGGRTWSPTLRIDVRRGDRGRLEVVSIDRDTR